MYTGLVAVCVCVCPCVSACVRRHEDTDNETLVVCVGPMMQRSGGYGQCDVKVHSFVFSKLSCDQSSVIFKSK